MPNCEAHPERPEEPEPQELRIRRSGQCTPTLAEVAADLGREALAGGAEGRANVFILTFCRAPELLYGSTLVFKTLRVGFPTASVTVVDNASIPEARAEIRAAARANGCRFLQIEPPSIEHHDFLDGVLRAMATEAAPRGPLVFLDPDLCFWTSCEDFTFDGLVAGIFMQPCTYPKNGALSMPRLHTSFLWIPDARKLRAEVSSIQSAHYDFHPFRCFSVRVGAQWCRYDTGAALYAAIRNNVSHFTERHLACYDHLFHGCHADWIHPWLDAEGQEILRMRHAQAMAGNLEALKGTWELYPEMWGIVRDRSATVT